MDSHDPTARRADKPWDAAAAAIVDSLGGAEVFFDQRRSESWRRGVTGPSNHVLGLFDFERLSELLHRSRVLPPQIRMLTDGPLEPARYMETEISRKSANYVRPRVEGVRQALEQGATLAVARVTEFDAGIEQTARAMQWWLGADVDATLYAVATETRGFAPHVDDHEVVIVQLEGSKHWTVWEPTRRFPLERDVARPTAPTELAWKGVLSPGDTLCLPRGYWHTAWTTDPGTSLHLTFGIRRRSGIDWLLSLADEARSSETFRQDLPQYRSALDRTAHHELMIDELTALARRHDWSAFLDDDRSTTISRNNSGLLPRALEESTTIWFTTAYRPVLRPDPPSIVLSAGGKRVRFDRRCRSLIERLMDGGPVGVDELRAGTELPDAQFWLTLRTLVDASLIDHR